MTSQNSFLLLDFLNDLLCKNSKCSLFLVTIFPIMFDKSTRKNQNPRNRNEGIVSSFRNCKLLVINDYRVWCLHCKGAVKTHSSIILWVFPLSIVKINWCYYHLMPGTLPTPFSSPCALLTFLHLVVTTAAGDILLKNKSDDIIFLFSTPSLLTGQKALQVTWNIHRVGCSVNKTR